VHLNVCYDVNKINILNEILDFYYRVWMRGYANIFFVPAGDTEESPLFFSEPDDSTTYLHDRGTISYRYFIK